VNHGGQPLTAAPIDAPLRVVHVEDEPEVVYAQLMATGIHPGMVVRVVEATSRRLTLVSAEDEYVLAPLVAGNVSVIPAPAEEAEPMNGAVRLSTVTLGKPALVKRLSPACRGMERRRLLDLGILPGTVLRPEIQSAGGDPVAYRVRGALIALRKEQADLIFVEAEE
jgi:DtxR family Mn-dependent transcriptional regulator